MNIVWFAEIKWDYLRTRKQQLIAKRPVGTRVVFLEPYVRGRANRYTLRDCDGVQTVTIPFLKSIPGGVARSLLNAGVARRAVDTLAGRRVRAALRAAGVDPAGSVFVISNVYAVRVARALPRRRLIYDCNDAHSEFPGAPSWTRRYQEETFRAADTVVVSSRGLEADAATVRGGGAGVHRVENGVDFALFHAAAGRRERLDPASVRVGYVGAVAPWFDFDLVSALARSRPGWSITIVGPVLGGAERDLGALAALPNVDVRPAVAHDAVPGIIAEFTVAMVPFRRTRLTAGVNPNKLYEYLAVGTPVVATPFSPDVEPLEDAVALAADAGAFAAACDRLVEAQRDPGRRAGARERAARLASDHDWGAMAGEFWSIVGA